MRTGFFRFGSQSNKNSEASAPEIIDAEINDESFNAGSYTNGQTSNRTNGREAEGRFLGRGSGPALFDPALVEQAQDENAADPQAAAIDQAFLHRLQSGDGQAWEQLMDDWSPKLYNYMCYNTRTVEDAQDVLSDTWLGLVQSINNFDGNVKLSTFIYSIAYRKVADYWRRSKQTYELPLWVSTAGPTSTAVELQEALAELPELAQQALLLRYHVGLSVAEIAEVLGRSYKATESLLSRVRRQFHHAFLGAEA